MRKLYLITKTRSIFVLLLDLFGHQTEKITRLPLYQTFSMPCLAACFYMFLWDLRIIDYYTSPKRLSRTGCLFLIVSRLIMNAKNSNYAWSNGSRGRGHVTMLYQVSWINWISVTSFHPFSHQSLILWHAHSWERRTLGTNQKESQMASCYSASATSLKPSFQCTLHGLFSDCTLSVLVLTRNSKKNLIVVDLLVFNNFQQRRETLKSN